MTKVLTLLIYKKGEKMNIDLNKSISSISTILAAVVLAIGLVITASQFKNSQQTKNKAIDGCLKIATTVEHSGNIEKNGWTVDKPVIDQKIYEDCMIKKGY